MDQSAAATITVRVVRSFEYCNIRLHVFRNVDLKVWTPRTLLSETKKIVQTLGAFRPFRTLDLNALKLYSVPMGTKTQNLAINLGNDEFILSTEDKMDKPLCELGVENESEISVYNEAAYLEYAKNPVRLW